MKSSHLTQTLGWAQYSTSYRESSRSAFERGREHRLDMMNLNPNSNLVRHMQSGHKEVDLTEEGGRMAENFFTMELVEQYRTAMDRQLAEALAIAKAGGMDHSGSMNNSDEYNRCLLLELKTTTDIKMRMKEREKRVRDEDREKRTSKRRREKGEPNSRQNLQLQWGV